MWRSLVAVFGGWLAIQFLVVITDGIFARIFPGQYGAGLPAPAWLTGLRLACGVLYTVFGGWLAVLLAPERPWRHALYLIVLGETMGILTAGMSIGLLPFWYLGGLLLLFPVAVLAGAWLRLRGAGQGSSDRPAV
ncbi:MAG: hypothetical protein ACOYX1_10470 [Acidobacteriota bacterium]